MNTEDLTKLYLHPEAEQTRSLPDGVRGGKPNRQLHQAERTRAVDADLAASGLAFYGDKNPNMDVLTERPEHRIMVYLRAQGKTTREIAEATNYSYHWVSQIVRQPWFKKRLVEMIDEEGRDQVQVMLKAEVMPSLETLVEIRDDARAKSSDRVAASRELLDRFLGKSVAKVETRTTLTVTDAASEAERNAQELTRINQELAARGVPVIGTSN